MTPVLFRLIAYKSYQLRLIEQLCRGKNISVERVRKVFDKEHNYATSKSLRPLFTITENAMWEYYLVLDSRLTQKMEKLLNEYKDHVMTQFIRERLFIPRFTL